MEDFFLKHQKSIITTVVCIFLAIPLAGLWRYNQREEANQHANSIYQFEQNEFESFKTEKTEDIITPFSELYKSQKGGEKAVLLGIQISDHLMSVDKESEALSILEMVKQNTSLKLQNYMISIRLAVLYENAGQLDKAISTLEELTQSPGAFLEEKIHLDLGRLYLAQKDYSKAKSRLQYVIDNGSDSESIKMAKLYLGEFP